MIDSSISFSLNSRFLGSVLSSVILLEENTSLMLETILLGASIGRSLL